MINILGYKQKQESLTEYCTGSTYEGQIDNLGFSGYGVYIYPHGVEYEGEFKDGQFHGTGTLKYPFGQTMDGVWHNGKLKKYIYKYSDGKQHYSKDWDYLRIPNRQYEAEKQEGFQPSGQEFISNNKPDPIIPPNTYDNADGSYYCATNKLICWNDHRIRDIVRDEQDTFIKENFRQEVDEVCGYRPEFYEQWSSGRKADVDAYIKQFKQNNKYDDENNSDDVEKETRSWNDNEIASDLYKNAAVWNLSQRRDKGHDGDKGHDDDEDKPNRLTSLSSRVVTVNSVRKIFPGYKRTHEPLTEYCTGSSYEGQIDNLGFSGNGVYIYPHGVEYEGEFKDGQFHGIGTLKYPFGQKMDGVWHKGKLTKSVYTYADGKRHYSKNWDYLRMPDRQYNVEKREGFQPPGQEYISSIKPDSVIPPNTYDNADGSYYSDANKLICWNDHRVRRIVKTEEAKLIKDKFRQEIDEKSGYRPEFYEKWCSGRKSDVEQCTKYFLSHNNNNNYDNINTDHDEKESNSFNDDEQSTKSFNVYIVKIGHERHIMT